jgi:hypothetical protein
MTNRVSPFSGITTGQNPEAGDLFHAGEGAKMTENPILLVEDRPDDVEPTLRAGTI